jgi:hypothetical protein
LKAVVYHADAHYADGKPVGDDYKKLFQGFNQSCHKHGLQTVHVTLEGFPVWGDEGHLVSGLDPKNMMLNREICFADFLEKAPEDVYWFTEPDYRIFQMWPELQADCALLYRHLDGVPLNPSWRIATKKAVPLFNAIRDDTLAVGKKFDWHCDSEAFAALWVKMKRPTEQTKCVYLGVSMEFRKFEDYVKPNPKYGRNYAGSGLKKELLRAEGR